MSKKPKSSGRRRPPRRGRASRQPGASPPERLFQRVAARLAPPKRLLPNAEEYRDRRVAALPILTRPPEGRLAWLLDFAWLDLDRLAPANRVVYGEVLRDLSTVGPRPGDVWYGSRGVTIGTTTLRVPEVPMRRSVPDPLLRDLQQELRRGLATLLESGAWDLPLPAGVRLWRFPSRREYQDQNYSVPASMERRDPDFVLYWDADVRTRVLHAVAALLLVCGARLRACKQCGKPFLRRKRAEYCSPACGQRFRDMKKQHKRGGRE